MSDTVKLIIEMPKEAYNMLLTEQVLPSHIDVEWLLIHGIPLDDVKAEIEQIYQKIDTVSHNEYENAVEQGKETAYENVLSILDNIGKAESGE